MSTTTIPRFAQWMDRISDWLNAILIKETRQALKSRVFLVTFLLVLLVSWLISMIGVMFSGDSVQYSETGPRFFWSYYSVLSFAIFVIVPFGAYQSLMAERDQNTYELLSITTLSPRGIVAGKLLSSLVQLLIYYSAITPFICFTYLLKGISVVQIAYILFTAFVASILVTTFALTLCTFARHRIVQYLFMFGLLMGLMSLFFINIGPMASLYFLEPIAFDSQEFWWGNAIFLSYELAFFLLLLQIAASQLTFEAGNRSSGIRVIVAAITAMSIAWYLFGASWMGSTGNLEPGYVAFCSTMSTLGLAVFGLFATTEEDLLSRRVRRELPNHCLLRILAIPFLPGGGRGMLYVLMLAGALLATYEASMQIWGVRSTYLGQIRIFVWACTMYVVTYLGFGSAVGRLIRAASSDVRAVHARVLSLFLFAGGAILPMFALFWDWRLLEEMPLLFISNPFYTLYNISDTSDTSLLTTTVAMLGLTTLLSLLCCLYPMIQGIREVLTAEVRPKRKRAPAAAETALVAADGAASA